MKDNLPQDGTVIWGVINNAGLLGPFCPTEWLNRDTVEKLVTVNILGTVTVALTFMPELIKSQGRLVNVTSICAFTPMPYISTYNLCKAGIQSFTDAIR